MYDLRRITSFVEGQLDREKPGFPILAVGSDVTRKPWILNGRAAKWGLEGNGVLVRFDRWQG